MDALTPQHLYRQSTVARLGLGKVLPQADLDGLQKPEQHEESQSAPVRVCWDEKHHVSDPLARKRAQPHGYRQGMDTGINKAHSVTHGEKKNLEKKPSC